MTVEPEFSIPNSISFEEAMDTTQTLLEQVEKGAVTDQALERAIAALVATENGARGFFVVYLSDGRSLPPEADVAVVEALKTSPKVIASLLIKNLAMSTAMAIFHRRNQNEELVSGSDRVQQRSSSLIQTLQTPDLKQEAHLLASSIDQQGDEYQAFLERWGYDEEQRQAIRQSLQGTNLL